MFKTYEELLKIKKLKTWPSVMNYIKVNGIYKYLDNYHNIPVLDSRRHSQACRGYIKKHHIIYAEKIRLWEILHGVDVVPLPKE